MFAVLMPEAALYYGLLMSKVSPDVALIPVSVAMMWSLVRLAQSGDGRWWLAAGFFAGLSVLSKFTAIMFLPAVAAFALVPDWRWRWLRSPYPYLAVLIAALVFSPVLIWNAQHDWASFRFQAVRATTNYDLSWRTLGDYIGLQFGLVGFVMLPVVLSGLTLTAWRGYRRREPIAILLSTAVLVPFLYFLWKSLTLRVGDTWPMFMWPIGFAATAINLAMLPREGWPDWMIEVDGVLGQHRGHDGYRLRRRRVPLLRRRTLELHRQGRSDRRRGRLRAGRRARAGRNGEDRRDLDSDDRLSHLRHAALAVPRPRAGDRDQRARPLPGFRDPGMDRIKGHAGLYVARKPDDGLPLWDALPVKRERLGEVERRWRGLVMDTYALEKLTGWTPDLSPPKDAPLFQWRVLAGDVCRSPAYRVARQSASFSRS